MNFGEHPRALDMLEFIKANIKGTSYKRVQQMVNEEFDTNFSFQTIKGVLRRNKIVNGRVTTWNGPDRESNYKHPRGYLHPNAARTTFKQGSLPHNAMPLGTLHFFPDYGLSKKIGERGKFTERWVAVAKLVWEEAHGPLPPGAVIYRIDGDLNNNNLDNLKAISRGDLVIMNRHLKEPISIRDSVLTHTCINLAILKQAIVKSQKKGECQHGKE